MKIDANQILREQGASALRGIMDAARPFNDHDVTGEAPATQTKPAGIDAPGLAWRPRKGGWAAVWIARQDIAKKGFKPATHQIGVFTSELTDDDQIKIRSECERLQREVLSWARMSKLNREANGMPSATSTFDPAPYAFPNPASIPRREWLFGRHYIRSAVGASIGAPGRLKSTTVLTEIIGMTVGRDLMAGEPLASGPLRGAYFNGEEVQDELDRRVAAVLQRFGLEPEDCGGRLWVRSTRDKPIKVAVRSPRGDALVQQGVVDGLKGWCDRNQIDALAIDPLISFHAVRETDNGDMDLVCKEAFGAIAGKTRAVDLVHHPRKLAPGESNATVDDARGASAILGAVRVARTFNFMTTAEAAQLGIHDDDRRRHVRIENGKNNPGPIGKAHWVRIETEILPNGDEVACATLWKPPNPFDGVTVSDLKVVQRLVQGGAFRTDSQSKQWLGWWMAENLPHLNIKTRHSDQPRDKAEVARLNSILKTWRKNQALEIETRQDEHRKERDFFIVGKPAELSATPSDAGIDDDQIVLQ